MPKRKAITGLKGHILSTVTEKAIIMTLKSHTKTTIEAKKTHRFQFKCQE